ncbi:hypothetical protein RhiirB3_473928 [Rhizophagus irregularis]|nr:hypothetical protein RhiirB3_473928 [Rhizophagus irregularis]
MFEKSFLTFPLFITCSISIIWSRFNRRKSPGILRRFTPELGPDHVAANYYFSANYTIIGFQQEENSFENKFWLIWRTYTYGKIKNKPRVKENAQPASSSRAAEIIATSGQAPIQNLGGFAQFLGGTAFSSTSTLATSDIDSAVSNAIQLALVLKRLSKRDPITKLKALEEFESYLKKILPVWIISLFDQNKDVARVANESFQAAFPPEKRVDVLVFGREEILSYITDIILYKTSETLSDPRFTSKEDMVSKYLKVVASSYYSLAHIISQLKEDELGKSAQQYDNLFDHSKFWANLSNAKIFKNNI